VHFLTSFLIFFEVRGNPSPLNYTCGYGLLALDFVQNREKEGSWRSKSF
jgi:hypothetical protein